MISKTIRDERGMALTEYLLLLGLLTGGVIGAVSLFGGQLGKQVTGWAGFLQNLAPIEVVTAFVTEPPPTDQPGTDQPNTDTPAPTETPARGSRPDGCSNQRGVESSNGAAQCNTGSRRAGN